MDKQWRHPGRQYVPTRKKRHIVRWSIFGIIALFAVINIGIWAIYRDRTYPGTTVMGTPIGSVAYGDLLQKVSDTKILPKSATLQYDTQKIQLSLDELGIKKDASRTSDSAEAKKLLLPVANFFTSPELAAPVRFDENVFRDKTQELAQTFNGEAVDARLDLKGSNVTITPGKDKYRLDTERLRSFVTTALDSGETTITVPVKTTPAAVSKTNLAAAKRELEQQLATSITLSYNGTETKPTKDTIAAWYIPSGTTYAASSDNIVRYLNTLSQSSGGYIKDNQTVTSDIQQALKARKSFSATLTSNTVRKKYTYCTAVKGVPATELPALRAKLESTFGDARGWSLNGAVTYTAGTAGCDFTVWLAAANLMPTFGAICDSMWSCRVGPNVVINYDRWQNASPAWQQFGGTLEEYRYMVINHETGHWLGYGHDHCGGPGQLAPVMQQQSIDLQGCTFSPWPNDAEKAALPAKQAF